MLFFTDIVHCDELIGHAVSAICVFVHENMLVLYVCIFVFTESLHELIGHAVSLICMYACMYVCMYVYVCHGHTAYVYVSKYLWLCVCVRVCVCFFVFVFGVVFV